MGKAKYDYLMDKASDTDTFKAVMFACTMIRQGKNPGIAIRTASRYYDCDMDEVAMLVGQRGGRTNAEKSAKNARKKAADAEKAKAKKLILNCIREHDGKPFFISHEERRLSEETGIPASRFQRARESLRDEGLIEWETLKDSDGHVIGTWFKVC